MEKTFIKSLSVLCVAGCAMLSLAQCSKINEPEEEAGPSGKTVTLTIRGEAPDTRTSLGENGAVLWNEGDMIWINDSEYQVIPDPENPYMATVPGVAESDEYHAMYGNITGYYEDEGYYAIWLDDWQEYHENSFDTYRCNPMVAFSKTTDIEFKNVAGILRIGLTGNASTEIKSITVVNNDTEKYMNGEQHMSGELQIPVDDVISGELKDSYECSRGSNYVLLQEIYTGLGTEPGYFHFIVSAQTYEKGITLIIEDTDGNVGFKRTENPVDVRRSNLVPMEPFEFEPAPAPEINVVSNEMASLSVNVSAEPGIPVGVALVTRSIYEAWPEETKDDFIRSLIEDASYTIPSEGTVNLGKDELGQNATITPSTDYIMAAAYLSPATGEVLGDIALTEMATAEPTGTVPTIEITGYSYGMEGGQYGNRVDISIASTDAAGISVFMNSASFYESLTGKGMSDTGIMASYGQAVGAYGVEEANNGSLVFVNIPEFLYPGSEYLIMVMATGDGGFTAFDSINISIPERIPEDAQWEIVSMTGRLTVELWGNIEIYYEAENIIVDRMSDRDIFRVPLSMNRDESIVRELRNYGLEPADDGTYYLYMAMDSNNNISMLPNESWAGFLYGGYPTYFTNNYGYANTDGETYYEFDMEVNLSYGSDEFLANDISNGHIRVYFENYGETYERNGLSTESFDNNNEIISW